jgi:hypothetical protein
LLAGFLKLLTIDIYHTIALADQALGRLEQVPEANAQPDVLEDLVGVFCVDVVLDGVCTGLSKVFGRNLDHVGNGCLPLVINKKKRFGAWCFELTRTNMAIFGMWYD